MIPRRVISGIYSHLYTRGWSGGWSAYRYGDEPRPIYDPRRRRQHVKSYLSNAMVEQVANLLRDVQPTFSRWSSEADTRIGLRRGLIGEGLGWTAADDTAAELIRLAFARLGAGARPDWAEGQRYYVLAERQCQWCGADLDGEHKFCSAEHARLALEHFDWETNWADTAVGRAAYRIIRRDREDERECATCGKLFRPMSADSDQRYCSRGCVHEALRVRLPSRDCEYCGAPFMPNDRAQRYCSQAHATAALRKANEKPCECCGKMFKPHHGDDPGRDRYCSKACAAEMRSRPKHHATCDWCGGPFLAKSRAGRFCCDAHYQAYRKASRGILPARISPPTFDFVFSVAA